ncbi:transcriptional repressor [Solirubrobacter sp. CPCC 204708]|uniref:Transcriptional repressor n=1 Tax=Solirubrobacter deserti TaxID=2282478 RepID=A0ABT4RJV0_9ACTN|nr:Fur family transcriptional regulator [Solirubrobacter deserti]MBE2315832.1 transcriptional repressor [Solirubrobacter deserti]MDA0138832.1 transcriptional repressor [Solirubrobacter deserti]
MTLAPPSEPLPFRDLEDVAAALRRAGSRLTTPRRMVLEALFAADELLTAEQIADGKLDLTSVYRNLEKLEELGVVRHVHIGHGPSVYGLLGDGEREFLVCERCGKVVVAGTDQLDRVRAVIREQFGYEARFTHFPLHGRCPDCIRR